MPGRPRVGVVGVAIQPCIPEDGRQSLEERLHLALLAALDDAGMAKEDLEGIVVGANDQYDGRAITVMMASAPLGGVDRDILSTPSSGEHAFILGALRIASGQFRTQLVAARSPIEASSIPEAQRLANDPLFHRRLPLDELAAAALQANALEHATPGTAALAEQVLAMGRANGARAFPDLMQAEQPKGKPTRWPLRSDMVPPPVTGIVALMLASEDYIAEHRLGPVAWISGMGWATEPAFLGDRDLATAPALDAAVTQAYREAGITDAQTAFDLAEVTDVTPYQALLALELLVGVSRDRQWGGLVLARGLGGVWVEALKDVALRLLPVDAAEVRRALESLRGVALLRGGRGVPPADLDAVAQAVVAIGQAALALGPSLATLEVNPLWVHGSQVEALDALCVWDETIEGVQERHVAA